MGPRICENRFQFQLTPALTSSPPPAPPSTTSWRVAAAHVLRAAAHDACAFGVDLAPSVHVYLGPVDDDPEDATAAGHRRRRKGAVLHYSILQQRWRRPWRCTAARHSNWRTRRGERLSHCGDRPSLAPWTPTRRTPSISRRPRSVGCARCRAPRARATLRVAINADGAGALAGDNASFI